MRPENYLNLNHLQYDKPIYRIMPIEYLYTMFSGKQNVLVKPASWEDPFENFVLRARVEYAPGRFSEPAFHDKMYGQCWSLESRSDALWRICSKHRLETKNEITVRVRTTIRKLANSLSSSIERAADFHTSIGKVQYLKDYELRRYLSEFHPADGALAHQKIFESLLIKRTAFRYENEVRLLYFALDKLENDKFCYAIDPRDLIEQVMLNPWTSVSSFTAIKDEIARETGLDEKKILRSLLYAPAPRTVKAKRGKK
jgi:hypothetical protein